MRALHGICFALVGISNQTAVITLPMVALGTIAARDRVALLVIVPVAEEEKIAVFDAVCDTVCAHLVHEGHWL